MEVIKKYLMAFLRFARIAAPIAASVAESTGHTDVVGDIEKAGDAATSAESALSGVDR